MKTQKQALWCIIFTLSIFLLILAPKRCQNEGNGANPVIIRDTLVSVIWDTVMLDHYETVVLPLTDTLWRDSVRVDSVRVELPVSRHIYDTILATDTTELGLRLSVSGYGVSLDSMMCRFRYSPTVVPKKSLFKDRFKVGVGVSAGYGTINRKADIYVGVGFFCVL